MTDYSTLIDAETWAFIRATEAAYPADTSGFTMDQHRAAYDALCAVFDAGRPAGLRVTDRAIAGVPCRVYHGEATEVVYFHGGGFYLGGLHSHDSICAEIAARTGLTVIAVDYRLSPEHDHPAAYDDAMAVTLSLNDPFLLAGDSAGGNLAAAVSHGLRGHGRRALGQVLIYPGLGGDIEKGSYLTHANAPMLTRADVILGSTIRQNAPDDPTAVPLRDNDFSSLPPTLALAAECDPLADDAAAYAAAITAAGAGPAPSPNPASCMATCAPAIPWPAPGPPLPASATPSPIWPLADGARHEPARQPYPLGRTDRHGRRLSLDGQAEPA